MWPSFRYVGTESQFFAICFNVSDVLMKGLWIIWHHGKTSV